MLKISNRRSSDAINDGEKLTATVSCATPYDIDDNREDDTAATVFSQGSTITVGISDVIVAIGISIVLVTIAFFAGLLQVREEESMIMSNESMKKLLLRLSR